MLGWGAASAFVGGELRRGETVRAIRRAVVQREDGRWGVGGEGCPWARAIGFGWQDLAILTEGPQARRNFIDGFAGKLYAAHLSGLGRYRQIVARRNHLLQNGVAGRGCAAPSRRGTSSSRGSAWSWSTRRRAAVEALEAEARGLYPTLAGAGAVQLAVLRGARARGGRGRVPGRPRGAVSRGGAPRADAGRPAPRRPADRGGRPRPAPLRLARPAAVDGAHPAPGRGGAGGAGGRQRAGAAAR